MKSNMLCYTQWQNQNTAHFGPFNVSSTKCCNKNLTELAVNEREIDAIQSGMWVWMYFCMHTCDVLNVSRSCYCLWHNCVIKHNVSISHISSTTGLFITTVSESYGLGRDSVYVKWLHVFSGHHTHCLYCVYNFCVTLMRLTNNTNPNYPKSGFLYQTLQKQISI